MGVLSTKEAAAQARKEGGASKSRAGVTDGFICQPVVPGFYGQIFFLVSEPEKERP